MMPNENDNNAEYGAGHNMTIDDQGYQLGLDPELVMDGLDVGADIAKQASSDAIEGLKRMSELDPDNFLDMMEGFKSIAGKTGMDSDEVEDFISTMANLRNDIIEDDFFSSTLENGTKVFDYLDKLETIEIITDGGKGVWDMFNSTADMFDIINNVHLTEQEKIDRLNESFDHLREGGADVVVAVVASTFGKIPYAGSFVNKWAENQLHDFVTSDGGLLKISNQIGGLIDKGIDKAFTYTGLKDWIIEKSGNKLVPPSNLGGFDQHQGQYEELFTNADQCVAKSQNMTSMFGNP